MLTEKTNQNFSKAMVYPSSHKHEPSRRSPLHSYTSPASLLSQLHLTTPLIHQYYSLCSLQLTRACLHLNIPTTPIIPQPHIQSFPINPSIIHHHILFLVRGVWIVHVSCHPMFEIIGNVFGKTGWSWFTKG